MILDSVILDSLVQWARENAPFDWEGRDHLPLLEPQRLRRRVRLEITAEKIYSPPTVPGDRTTTHDRVICRVYLAEPRCEWFPVLPEDKHDDCLECRPLIESRIA